jgi:hypothetical protein
MTNMCRRVAFGVAALAVVHGSTVGSGSADVLSKEDLAAILLFQRESLQSFSVHWSEKDSSPDPIQPDTDGFFAVEGPEDWRQSMNVHAAANGKNWISALYDSCSRGGVAVSYSSEFGWATVAPTTDIAQYGPAAVPGSRYLRFLMYWPAATTESTSQRDLLALLSSSTSSLRGSLETVAGVPCHVLDVHAASGTVVGTVWIDAASGGIPRRQVWNPDAPMTFQVDEVLDLGGVFLPKRCVATFPTGHVLELVVSVDAGGAPRAALDPSSADLPENPISIVPPGSSVNDLVAGTTYIAAAGKTRERAREIVAHAVARLGPIEVQRPSSHASTPTSGSHWLATSGVVFASLGLGLLGGRAVASRTGNRAPRPKTCE